MDPGSGKIFALVLAAGFSSRMGRFKLLARLGDKTLIDWVLDNLQSSRVDGVLVVLGHHAPELLSTVRRRAFRWVVNPDYRLGQSTSVKLGVRTLGDEAKAVIIHLGDQPFVGPRIINALIERYRQTGSRIVYPVCEGMRRNPTLIHSSLFGELLTLEGDAGARAIVEAHSHEAAAVEVGSPPEFLDVDTEEDLKAAERLIPLFMSSSQ